MYGLNAPWNNITYFMLYKEYIYLKYYTPSTKIITVGLLEGFSLGLNPPVSAEGVLIIQSSPEKLIKSGQGLF